MDNWDILTASFPKELCMVLNAVSPALRETVQEIRLRSGQAVSLCCKGRQLVIENRTPCRPEWITDIFETACDRSVYAHQEEIRHGFVTDKRGVRIGLAGTAVCENGVIISYRDISALCIRIPREHKDCSAELAKLICGDGRIHGTLICGEPSSGKSTLLRDLIAQLSACGFAVVVVDERGELSAFSKDLPADILLYAPKVQGIEQAIRCLAPQVILFDELGGEDEIRAVMNCLSRGVPVISTLHCRTPREWQQQTTIVQAARAGAFEYAVFLQGREEPGKIRSCFRTEVLYSENGRTDTANTDRVGIGLGDGPDASKTRNRIGKS